MANSAVSARGIGHFKIATFSHLSGMYLHFIDCKTGAFDDYFFLSKLEPKLEPLNFCIPSNCIAQLTCHGHCTDCHFNDLKKPLKVRHLTSICTQKGHHIEVLAKSGPCVSKGIQSENDVNNKVTKLALIRKAVFGNYNDLRPSTAARLTAARGNGALTVVHTPVRAPMIMFANDFQCFSLVC